MKFIIKVSTHSLIRFFLTLLFATIPIISFAARDIIDTSSSEDLLMAPAIVVRPSKIEPDCHSYTGCSLVVGQKYYRYHHYKHKHVKPKRHCDYLPY